MSKKVKKKKRNAKPPQPRVQRAPTAAGQVRLSQVMIVKNEEKNIETALDWAKDIAFEQIIVDTGSSDRTVELALKHGATVYDFEWINDFSAAKNFAMDKAKGDWIAVLDADEYMLPAGVNELMNILSQIQSNPDKTKKYDAVDTSMTHLDDEGNVYSITPTRRFFRNTPELRFEGKVHEAVRIKNPAFDAPNIQVIHTGYAISVYNENNKRERNLKLLRDEYERDPEAPNILIYLADAIKSEGTEEARAEAEPLYIKALESKRPIDIPIRQLAYDFLIPRLSGDGRSPLEVIREDDALKLCDRAIVDLPDMIDYHYYRAVLYNKKGDFGAAKDDLDVCERAFMTGNSLPVTRVLLPSPMPLFYQLRLAAEGSGDDEGVVRNSTILNSMLTEAKAGLQVDFVGSFIKSVLVYGISEDEALAELAGVFNLSDPKDLMFIIRAAKDAGVIGFARKVMDMTALIME